MIANPEQPCGISNGLVRVSALAALLLTGVFAGAAEPPPDGFRLSAQELAMVLSHGPWPAPARIDPSNRGSGHPAAIKLGKALFFEPKLSPDEAFACSTCHQPDKAFTDRQDLGLGRLPLERNTLTVVGTGLQHWFGWDGGNDNLWAQSVRPILATYELGSTPGHVQQVVAADERLSCYYREAFGVAVSEQPPRDALVGVGKALAAYQESLRFGRSEFDAFRDALARGDQSAMDRYPSQAQRGLKLFVGHGRCSLCHAGPAFSSGEFESVGIPHFLPDGRVDKGRYGGISDMRRSPVNLLGRYNDDPASAPGTRTRHVALHPRTFGQFKVPSLRSVALTAPYMHAGSHRTLAEVIEHYDRIDLERLHVHGDQLLRPLGLSAEDRQALERFLQSLTGKVEESELLSQAVTPCDP